MPPGWKPARSREVDRLYSLVVGGGGERGNGRRFSLLYVDTWQATRARELDLVLGALAADLQLYVAEHSRRGLFLHAGVVGWRGRAILVPGRSMSGKSTLVAALVRAGATYYSDEYAVLDRAGRVGPYPEPLSIRRDSPAAPLRVRPEDLGGGGAGGDKPLPVGLVVLGAYRPGATWKPRRLSPGQAAMALLAHTVAARRRPMAALRTLSKVVSQARVLKGLRGEAAGVAPALLEWAGRGT